MMFVMYDGFLGSIYLSLSSRALYLGLEREGETVDDDMRFATDGIALKRVMSALMSPLVGMEGESSTCDTASTMC